MAQVSSMLGAADLTAIRLERLRVTVTGFAQRGYSGALEFHEDGFPNKNEQYLKPNGHVDDRAIAKSLAEHWEGIDKFIELPTTYLLLQFEYGVIRGIKINDVKTLRE